MPPFSLPETMFETMPMTLAARIFLHQRLSRFVVALSHNLCQQAFQLLPDWYMSLGLRDPAHSGMM